MAKKKIVGKSFLDEKGQVPILGAHHSNPSNMGDLNNMITAREKIMASGTVTGMDFVNSAWYSPELMPDVWMLPKSRLEILKWCRFFYNTDPYIYSIINMHTLYPFSMFDIVASTDKVSEFYTKAAFNREFNLYDLILDMGLAYNKFGEAIVMGQPETITDNGDETFKWKNFILFEPEVINIYKSALERKEVYSLVITPEFKDEIKSLTSKGKEVHPLLKEAMLTNKSEVDLDPEYISKIINKTDPSAQRGTSPIQPLLRTLMYQDKVNQLKITAIDRYRYPLEIWKIGDIANNIIPDINMLKTFETMIKQAKENPPYSLFIPPYVNFDTAGFGKEKSLFDYKDDYEWVRDSILVGMGVTKDLIMGDSKGWSNSKQLTLQKLAMVYSATRDKFTNWMINQFFYPIAEKNDFITETGDLNLPQIAWYKDLEFDSNKPEEYMKLYKDGLISTKTLFSKFKDLDLNQEQQLLKDEIGSIFDDEKRIKNRNPKPLGEDTGEPKGKDNLGDEGPMDEPGDSPSSEDISSEPAPEEGGGGGGGEAPPEAPTPEPAAPPETPAT